MNPLDRLIAGALPWIPRSLVWRVARRYIAGLDFDDARSTVDTLSRKGLCATLDYLGESVTTAQEAESARDVYLSVLHGIRTAELPAGISVKLTQLGLKIDPGLAERNVTTLVDRAEALRRFVRIDMEDSSTTDATLAIYRGLRARHANVGLVLQAYLRRSLDDLRLLLPLEPDVRICKGIYREPLAIAYHGADEIRASFLTLVRALLEGRGRAAVATHDPPLLSDCLSLGEALRVPRERLQFQMLLGVGQEHWPGILSRGHKLRIYVPFGRSWHAYSLRRLRENPRIAGYVFRALLRF